MLSDHSFDNPRNLTIVYSGEFKDRVTYSTFWDSYGSTTTIATKDNTKAKLYISKVNDATGYQVKVFKDAKYKNKVFSKKTKASSITLQFEKDTNKDYYIRVRPYKVVNGVTTYGKWRTDKVYIY